MDIRDTFDKVVLINLKRRPDRLAAVQQQVLPCWPFREPEVFEAIDGSKVPSPLGWQQGGGTWGCLQSHRQILERAIMDGVKSLLVLEDDLYILKPDTFADDCSRFIESVPPDWDQLMLGGQHMGPTHFIRDGVVKVSNCQRTHAYAIRGKFLRDLYATWCSHLTQGHCDHVMGPMQSRYKVYAPDPFIFGQAAGHSDITCRSNPAKAWIPPTGKEPILLLDCPREIVAELRRRGVHTGYDRDPRTDIDKGLIAAYASKPPDRLLRKWITHLMWECASEPGTLLGIWHPQATLEMIERCYNGPVILVKASTLEEALLKLPSTSLPEREVFATRYVILLRANQQVAGMLRGLGWHQGNWRDPVTDIDNGLREWAISRKPERLRQVIEILAKEAEGIRNGVATLWHPELTLEMAQRETTLRVVEIEAKDVEEAVMKWDQARSQS